MQKLSLIIGLFLIVFYATAQDSPHGDEFQLSCTDCHTTSGWTFDKDQSTFNHNSTSFTLEGQHTVTDCKSCHTSLVFSEAPSNCIECHTDMHNNTVGPNCAQCHTPQSWLVSNITDIHQISRFPLLGAHNTASCSDCHLSASKLEFQPLGVECIDCHRNNYLATTNPNHVQTGLSTNCIECHRIDAFEWSAKGINHDFFPLTKGHDIENCAECHKTEVTDPISPDCYSCHQTNYLSTTTPSHQNLGFSNSCKDCHSTDPGWKPADFRLHDDLYFPVYSGSHRGEWNSCTDCHTQAGNYNTFSCTDCHEHNKSDMDKEHQGENGYSYNSLACFACHPTGREEGAFNHSSTGFIIKGGHLQADCLDCHTNGYAGTSPLCVDCHTNNYNEAANPNHVNAGISNECITCHDDNNWSPSLFEHGTTSGFVLTGGHSGKQCAECHIGTTSNASSECFSCHQANYNSAPNHLAQNYPTACLQCHTVNNWEAANFDHNLTNFPLTGAHIATECSACHTDGYQGTSMLCNLCHTENYNTAQSPVHTTAGISIECEACHTTTAWVPSQFDHLTTTSFALTGGHSGKQCAECHVGTTSNANSECFSCHQANYNEAPNHIAQNYPTACLQCHTVNNWEAANFDHNLTNFPLTGAHMATECSACHTDGYAGTSMLCNSCHAENYNTAQSPVHTTAGISTECESCHTTAAWIPSGFDHVITTGFELTGGHSGKQCAECHVGTTSNASSECFSCHQANYDSAPNHLAQNYPTACLQCHTVNNWEAANFDHNLTNFPLTGAHIATECSACHTNGYEGTSMLCNSCHTDNYNQTTNPSHTSLGLTTSCEQCHTTNPGWEPATFPNHNDYYALNGAHAGISNNCYLCHSGNYTNTGNTCFACHSADYNATTDPSHSAAQFSTDCESCHSENAWTPSTFDHDAQYFPIYSGEHRGEWNSCTDCHTESTNYAVFSCVNCHEHNQTSMDDKHHEVNNYVYNSTNCLACHPRGEGDD